MFGVAQLIERQPQDQMDSMTQGSNLVSTRTNCDFFFRVKNVVLTRRRCAQPPVCIYTCTRSHTHVKDPVVHVKVWWITET